jgi:hypothetical protein
LRCTPADHGEPEYVPAQDAEYGDQVAVRGTEFMKFNEAGLLSELVVVHNENDKRLRFATDEVAFMVLRRYLFDDGG